MRKLFTTYFFLVSAYCFAQTSIRVQNGQNLQTAIDNAPAGATILVDGGWYGDISLNKKVTLIGAGAFIANPSIIQSIIFNLGCDNSTLMGFKIPTSSNYSVLINRNVNNILIKNNSILGAISTEQTECTLNCGSINNLTIIHNILGTVFLYPSSQVNNLLIRNNIVFYIVIGSNPHPATGSILNNTVTDFIEYGSNYQLTYGSISCASNIVVKNNILINNVSYNSYSISSLVNYNAITDYSTIGIFDNTNTINLDRNSIFLGFPINVGGESLPFQFQLALDSPARGVGENGVDCGAFGGTDPFPLSGTTGPQIYELAAPSSVSSGQTLNVTVKAKVSN